MTSDSSAMPVWRREDFLERSARIFREEFEALMKGKGCAKIGKVTEEEKLLIHGLNGKVAVDASLAELRKSWKKPLSGES